MFVNERLLRGVRDTNDWKESYVPTISSIRLPNFSYKAEIIASTEKCFYDGISQRIVREEVIKRLNRKIGRSLDLFSLLYLKIKFMYWYNRINRSAINRKYHKRYYPKLITDNVTDIWPYRKGLQIIVGYYYEIYCKKTRSAFQKWKLHVRELRNLMRKMFDKWSIKSSRIILSRMNARRFLYLTTNLNNKIRKSLRKYYWGVFRYACDLVLIRRHVRLLFRCWYTVVKAMLKGRRLVKQYTLKLLIENKHDEKLLQNEINRKCHLIQSRNSQIVSFNIWYKQYKKYKLLKRMLIAYSYSELYNAWNTWVYKVRLTTHKVEVNPVVLATPCITKPPIKPTVSSYKRRGSRLPRVPPHIVVPLLGLQSYAMVHNPSISPLDRIEYRVHRAARLSSYQEQRSVPVEVEEIRASLQGEILDFKNPAHSQLASKTVHNTSKTSHTSSNSTATKTGTTTSSKKRQSNGSIKSYSSSTKKPVSNTIITPKQSTINTPTRSTSSSSSSSYKRTSTPTVSKGSRTATTTTTTSTNSTYKIQSTPSYGMKTAMKTPISSKQHY